MVIAYFQVRPLFSQVGLVFLLGNVRAVRGFDLPCSAVQPVIRAALQLPVNSRNMNAQLVRHLSRLHPHFQPLFYAQAVCHGQVLIGSHCVSPSPISALPVSASAVLCSFSTQYHSKIAVCGAFVNLSA